MNDIKTGQPMSTDEEIKAEVKELINDVMDLGINSYTEKYGGDKNE